MGKGMHKRISISRANSGRTIFMFVLLFAHSALTAWPQDARSAAAGTDPQQTAATAARERLGQDERNVAVQQTGLAEFEARALKIRRQLEALALTPEAELPARLLEYASGMSAELKALERHIQATKWSMAAETQRLEASRRQLNAQEDRYRQKGAADRPQTALFQTDDYRGRVEQQNARLREEADQRRAQIALQNQRLMREADAPLPAGPGKFALRLHLTDDAREQDELRLCEMLERMVAGTGYDIAEINLLVAKGLPGAEDLDVGKSLKTLDLWAAWVKHETDRHLYRFRKAPKEYNDSEAYFRILMMICTLQEDFHVCYNKDPKMRAGPVELAPSDLTFFGNPKDLFVNGLTEGDHEGTCASLPVLYVAIGRRLGYPLRLVECKGHLFLRWEDDKERFNIEGTNRGLNCYPDQEYLEWPYPISKEELATGMYMKSLSPKRELAAFLELRALCLKQHGREGRRLTVKLFADGLRKKEGVDLDRLNRLVRQYPHGDPISGTVGSALPYQTLTNTNSWRVPGHERGASGKNTVFATERSDPR